MKFLRSKKVFPLIVTVVVLVIVYKEAKNILNIKNILYSHELIDSDRVRIKGKVIHDETDDKKGVMKYILQWTSPKTVPFVYMGEGRKGFIERKCPYTNCIVTGDRLYLGDYSKFDVIAFAGLQLVNLYDLPKTRSPHQKYVFASIESPDNYPTCSNRFDGYFNWTWTFKLNSEVQWGYFAIRDNNNILIGPKKEMHWIELENMDPVSDEFKEKLKTKTRAAAWLVSNCHARSKREEYVAKLKEELHKYKMDVDIYGKCGNLQCDGDEECNKLFKKDYYFYLSFENSFSEDYVTEKLLHAVENDVVPIVYGGANYTSFIPDGVYLNARELSIKELAAKMNELINDPEKYSEYFKWKNHYSYHRQFESVAETDPYCLFCAHLNDEEMVKKATIYKDFRKWWDPPGRC